MAEGHLTILLHAPQWTGGKRGFLLLPGGVGLGWGGPGRVTGFLWAMEVKGKDAQVGNSSCHLVCDV